MNWKGKAFLLGLVVCLVGVLAAMQPLLSTSLGTEKVAEVADSTSAESGAPAAIPVLLAQAQSDAANTTTTITTTRGGWTVTCNQAGDPPVKTCSAEFRVVGGDKKQTVLIWLIGRNKEGRLLAEFVTPSDILIKPGVAVTLDDGKPVQAEYISCTARQGCRASMELTPKIVRDLQAAAKAKIGITLLNGKVMDVQFEVTGTDLALADIGAG